MIELIQLSWRGWSEYVMDVKLIAIVFAALPFLWIYKTRQKNMDFVLYTTVTVFCCVIPFIAPTLMLYQTRFYDYRDIWCLVPVTAMTAYAITVFLYDFVPEYTKRNAWKMYACYIFLLGILFLCGDMNTFFAHKEENSEKYYTFEVLERIEQMENTEKLVLWAPSEILAYAREYDTSIELLYGRNMWDLALNAYSFDTYPDTYCEMYEWIEYAFENGEGEYEQRILQPMQYIELLREKGVNCIVLPKSIPHVTLKLFEHKLQQSCSKVGNYYIFFIE